MKQFIFPTVFVCAVLFACKKSSSDNGGQGNGTSATVTFTNNQLYPQRLIVTGTGADTLYPFPNKVLDIDVAAKTSITRTDIPEGTRKIWTAIVCSAGQPINAACTTIVFRKAVYLKGSSYTEVF